jgi:23S rRNA pseudouridine1911/1915/1917 synthase
LSHPTSIRNINIPSVVWWVYHHYKKMNHLLPQWNASFIRAGLVHRLDMDTDGFMIIAKTEAWLAYFKGLFQAKSKAITKEAKEAVPLHKYYRAHCLVSPEGDRFLQTIQEQLPHYIEQVVIPKVPYTEPKLGITKIIAFTRLEDDSVMIDLEILTWRTHQIRYHLSKAWLPIIADPLYGEKMEATPLQLTAWKLNFLDMHWTMKEFSMYI